MSRIESGLARTFAAGMAAVLLAGMSVAGVAAGDDGGDGDGLRREHLRRAADATDRFHNLNKAISEGYGLPPEGPLHECIASFDDTGAMGFHYINGGLIDGEVKPRKPEALVYAPNANGRLRLVALEYVVFETDWMGDEPPQLFGREFMYIPEPNRYELPAFYALHAWIWRWNPAGRFEPFNTRVSCD